MVKLALLPAASTVTLLGTVAAIVLLLARFTTAPSAGATPLKLTVPCEELPPITLVGFSVSEEMVSEADNEKFVVVVAPLVTLTLGWLNVWKPRADALTV